MNVLVTSATSLNNCLIDCIMHFTILIIHKSIFYVMLKSLNVTNIINIQLCCFYDMNFKFIFINIVIV